MTAKQKQLLDFIKARMAETGVCPSMQEMADAMGLKSKNSIHRMIVALEEAGHIARLPYRARSLALPGEVRAEKPVYRDELLRLSSDLANYRKTRAQVCADLRRLAWTL